MKIWHYVLIAIFSVLILAVIGFTRWMRPYDLPTERAAARAAGIPLTTADVHLAIPRPEENAATEYNALTSLTKRRPLNTRAFDAATMNLSLATMDDRQARDLKALLASRQDVTRLVHAAAAKPHAYFQHEWTLDVLFPQFAQMRECAKWIRWESVLMAREGRYADAVRNQALGFRIAQHAADEPILIAHLVSIACDGITLSGFEEILDMAGPNATVASAVRREIAAYVPRRDFQRSLRFEALFGLTTLRQMTSAADISAISTPAPAPWKNTGHRGSGGFRWLFLDPSEAIYLHWMTRQVQAAGEPLSRRKAAIDAVQAEMERSAGHRPTYLIATIMTPVFSKAAEGEERSLARRALVSAVADVLRFHAANGRWPDTLGAASRVVPIDPYRNRPLGYRLEGAGFVVSAQPDVSGLSAKDAATLRRWNIMRYPPRGQAVPIGSPTQTAQ